MNVTPPSVFALVLTVASLQGDFFWAPHATEGYVAGNVIQTYMDGSKDLQLENGEVCECERERERARTIPLPVLRLLRLLSRANPGRF